MDIIYSDQIVWAWIDISVDSSLIDDHEPATDQYHTGIYIITIVLGGGGLAA